MTRQRPPGHDHPGAWRIGVLMFRADSYGAAALCPREPLLNPRSATATHIADKVVLLRHQCGVVLGRPSTSTTSTAGGAP
jgi:hypothetical protein